MNAFALSGNYELDWEHDRNTYSGETTITRDFSKSASIDWDFTISRTLSSNLLINLYRNNSYSSDNFSISPKYNIRKQNIYSSFSLTKYSYIDGLDYIEQDYSLEYSKPVKNNNININLSKNNYNYIDESNGYNDYFISSLSLDYYIPISDKTTHDFTYSYNSQNTHFDDSQDYNYYQIDYEYNTDILNILKFTGNLSFLKQSEKGGNNSDFQEFVHEITFSHSWKNYEISIRDSETYHSNKNSQLYDSSYSESESEFNFSGTLFKIFSFYLTALSTNEEHREFPEENLDNFDFSLSLTFTFTKWELSLSNDLNTTKYPIKDIENTNQNQKSIMNQISISYFLGKNTSIGFDISYDKTKYEYDIESKDINSNFSLKRQF